MYSIVGKNTFSVRNPLLDRKYEDVKIVKQSDIITENRQNAAKERCRAKKSSRKIIQRIEELNSKVDSLNKELRESRQEIIDILRLLRSEISPYEKEFSDKTETTDCDYLSEIEDQEIEVKIPEIVEEEKIDD